MNVKFEMDGFRGMERALAELKRSTSRAVARRAMKSVLKPVADMADSLTEKYSIAIGVTLEKRQKRAAKADFGKSVVSMFIGPVGQDRSYAPEATFDEFGTPPRFHRDGKYVGEIQADPFMRPAWDAYAGTMIQSLGSYIWDEIDRAIKRAAAKAARDAAKGK